LMWRRCRPIFVMGQIIICCCVSFIRRICRTTSFARQLCFMPIHSQPWPRWPPLHVFTCFGRGRDVGEPDAVYS
jgi:hypothetical protein